MIIFKSVLQKFGNKGEKTGWTYIEIPLKLANRLKPGCKKSFRVKGKIDDHNIAAIALTPMGEGDFILAVNAFMRKAIKKIHGASINVELEVDEKELVQDADLITCLLEEAKAHNFYKSLPPSHQNWFSNWVKGAKTEATKTKRIATVVISCLDKLSFTEMMKTYRDEKKLIQ